jgi:elongation factor P
MSLVVTALRNGTSFLDPDSGQPFVVVKYEHIKCGRGGATIKVKARNILTGAIIERSYNSGGKVEEVDLSTKYVQYLYKEPSTGPGQDTYYFMDPESFEQLELSEDLVGEAAKFLTEGAQGTVKFYESHPIAFELPNSLVFTVTYTEPGFKGNTVTNALKPATIETGATVMVPAFISAGEKIKVDTRDGKYIERA